MGNTILGLVLPLLFMSFTLGFLLGMKYNDSGGDDNWIHYT